MKKISAPLVLVLHLIYPVCLGIGILIRREFILNCDWAYFLALTAATIPLICIAASRELPLIQFTAIILDALCAMGCPSLIPRICAVIWILCCLILYLRNAPRGVVKILVCILGAVLLLIPVAKIASGHLIDSIGFSSFGDQIQSPDGRYTVYMHTMDYGFSAGTGWLTARDNSKAVNILIGKFYPPAEDIGSTSSVNWFQEISWPDGNTVQIGDEEFTLP